MRTYKEIVKNYILIYREKYTCAGNKKDSPEKPEMPFG